MSELLSPAGTLEAFYAAISNGADAIYLGLDKFNARAYATNFSLNNLKDLLDFAHLRNVKIYVTLNTIIYDNELEEVYKTIDELANLGVDAIIVQDLAVFSYITNHYSSLQAHCSTQMGIDDIEGATLVKKLGASRIVFARETNLETLKEIKNKLHIDIEAFIHGALCVSYSGNCFMSSMIGERSGNRGRCAGCCRKFYSLIDLKENKPIYRGYLLSMKDLNTSNHLKDMSFIDSFKIEGRMKEPTYVGGVTRLYRSLIDNNEINEKDFTKLFNRTFTKGFINNESVEQLTNIVKPNNYGYLIGNVEKQYNNKIWIRLTDKLNKGDQIRIETKSIKDEISLPINKMFDYSKNEIVTADKCAVIFCNKNVAPGAKIYKTKDIDFNKSIELTFKNNEYKKLPLSMEIKVKIGKPLVLKTTYQKYITYNKSDFLIEKALTSATTKDNIKNQLNKLKDTPYFLENISIDMDEDVFIPLKNLNELRRKAIENIDKQRLAFKVIKKENQIIIPKKHEFITPEITVEVNNDEQYELVKSMGIKHIYYKNIINRNNAKYLPLEGEVLVGGLGGIHYYKNNTIVSDYSLNVTNHISVGLLSSLGVERITLSQEIDIDSIKNLISSYQKEFNTAPNLELIIYGRNKIMHSKYCPLKRLNMCGNCKKSDYGLKDDFATFPLKFNSDCTINLYNSKIFNAIDDIQDIKGVNYFRLSFFDEGKETITDIIETVKNAIENKHTNKSFDNLNHTHGHFYKNPL